MALAAAMHHREHDRIRKAAEYKSTRKSSASDLTLGGVVRLPRVLHLEPKASKRRRKAGVSEGEAKSMAATRM